MGGKPTSQLIGYKYYLGQHLVLCDRVDAIKKIEAGEKAIWSGSISNNTTVFINKPNIFGGERKEGGIQGNLDFMFGKFDQPQNSYLKRVISANVPFFRRLVSLVFNKGLVCAMSPYIKPWAIDVYKSSTSELSPWRSDLSDINGGMNPVHIIYEAITNKDWGLGLAPGAYIDEANFAVAATTLKAEGLGLSFILSGQMTFEKLADEIKKVINGLIYQDDQTGKYQFKLIRNDYVLENTPVLDRTNILKFISFERPQYSEMVNEIVINYLPQFEREKKNITLQNLSAIQSQGAVISQTLDFIGLDSAKNAGIIGQRELNQNTTPLAKIVLTVNRSAFSLKEGDVFRLTWPKLNIEQVTFRIAEIDLGTLTDNGIRISAFEDIFALPQNTYLEDLPSKWIDPIKTPVPIPIQIAKELTYWEIATSFDRPDLDALEEDDCYFQLLASNPAIATPGYQLESKVTSGLTYQNFGLFGYTPYIELIEDIDQIKTTAIKVSDATVAILSVVLGTFAYIDNEVIRIDSFDNTNNTINVGRGCLDTIAAKHQSGALIWFSEDQNSTALTIYTAGESISGRGLVQTGSGTLDPSLAPVTQLNMVGRQNRPYPPGKFRINNLAYPSQITGSLVVTWAHRDRTLQLARPIISEEIGNIGPETGVTYTLELYDENGVLRKTVTGLIDSSYTWTTEEIDSLLTGRLNKKVSIKLWAVRDGVGSYQIYNFDVTRPAVPEIITAPVITGNPSVGELLMCSEGVWDNSPTSFEYQWLRNVVDIPNEITNTYLITDDDKGKTLTCNVKAVNQDGSTTILSSNSILIPG